MTKCIGYLAAILFPLLVLVGSVWYFSPARIEKLDSMRYCACGYSTVAFRDGKVIMVKYHHPDVKSGDQIGTYSVSGSEVTLNIVFSGKTSTSTYQLDNIGLAGPMPGYQAVDGKSPKIWIYGILGRLGLH